jgi:purine-cytosine permease-like protein
MDISRAASTDAVGRIEEAGIECLPESERTSRPRNLFYVFVGLNFSWAVVVYGWLPMTFGLTFWSAAVSMTAGIVVGSLLAMWVALLGPRTGTNMAVSSGAHFGINGRLIGTGLTVLGTLVYTAVTVWTSGDAVVASGNRLFGLADNNWVRAITYGITTLLFIVIALYGHATIVATQKVVAVVCGVVLVAGVFAYSGSFDAGRSLGEYALGSYWPTWVLSFVLGVAGPISYATIIGDYTRRISRKRFSDRQVLTAIAGGLIVGEVIPMVFGMFTAAAFLQTSDSYMFDLVGNAPGWYVLPILVVGVLGGLGQGVTSMYGTGLDLESLLSRLSRVQTTTIAAVLSTAAVFLGVFVLDAADAFTAVTIFLNAITVPWVAVLACAAIRNRNREYDLYDLQAFAQHRRGGRYWFTGGWNLPAVIAWLSGAVVGALAVNTGTYVGPLADALGGIDLTTLGSGLIAVAVYVVAILVVPDRVDAPAGQSAPETETPAVATP